MKTIKYLLLLFVIVGINQSENDLKEKISEQEKIDKSELEEYFGEDLAKFKNGFYGTGLLFEKDSMFAGTIITFRNDTIFKFLIAKNEKTGAIFSDYMPVTVVEDAGGCYKNKYELNHYILKSFYSDSLQCFSIIKVEFEPTLVDTFQYQYSIEYFERRSMDTIKFCNNQ